jgi:hypothetical protein
MERRGIADEKLPTGGRAEPDRASLQYVDDALRGLRFGTVTVVVHDGQIVQIERTEKTRLQPPTR